MINKLLITSTLAIFLLSSCKVKDLRTDFTRENKTEQQERRGRALLEETYLAMGYDHLDQTNSYEVQSVFDWKWPWSWMPMNALPGNKNKVIHFKFATNTFDGLVEYQEGRKAGDVYGLQSWQSYKIKQGKQLKQVKGSRRKWGLATYHYVIEAPMRVLDAEIVRYAGEKEFEGQLYDLVFVTWGKDEPHKEHDQYLIYINQQTKMTDLMEITINDFFLPMPNNMKDGTIRAERKKTSIGAYLPSNVYIQLGGPKKASNHVYQFSLYDYKFDTVQEEELYPIEGLEKVGDDKKQVSN